MEYLERLVSRTEGLEKENSIRPLRCHYWARQINTNTSEMHDQELESTLSVFDDSLTELPRDTNKKDDKTIRSDDKDLPAEVKPTPADKSKE